MPRLLLALHVYTPSSLLVTSVMVSPPSPSRTSAPSLVAGTRGDPLKSQEKLRVGSGSVAHGSVTDIMGMPVKLSVWFRKEGGPEREGVAVMRTIPMGDVFRSPVPQGHIWGGP